MILYPQLPHAAAEHLVEQRRRLSVQQAASMGDNGTRALFESILNDEEAHIDWLEAQLDQIRLMGIENYLAQQVG